MKRQNEVAMRQHADGSQESVPTRFEDGSQERVPARFEEDEQTRENFRLIDAAIDAINAIKIKSSSRRGGLLFWFVVVLILMILTGGGMYYLGSRSQETAAEKTQQATEQKTETAQVISDETRQKSINDAAVALDVAQGMPEYLARYKQKMIARARQSVVGLKALGAGAKQLQEAEQTLANLQRMTQKEWEDKISSSLDGWRGFFIFIGVAMLIAIPGGASWAFRRYRHRIDRYNLLLWGYIIFEIALMLVGTVFLAPWLAYAFA